MIHSSIVDFLARLLRQPSRPLWAAPAGHHRARGLLPRPPRDGRSRRAQRNLFAAQQRMRLSRLGAIADLRH